MERLFRGLVVTYVALTVTSYLLPVFWTPTDEEVSMLMSWDGFKAIAVTSWPIYWFFLIAEILISIGLFLFHSSARVAFLVLIGASILFGLLWGFRVTSPIQIVIDYLGVLLQGAIIGIAYFSSISQRFMTDAS